MDDRFNLKRFVEAQDPVYERLLSELRRGRKTTHWMWFVFPQIAGLGVSEMSRRFSISSIAEARAYLSHPVLGPRWRNAPSWSRLFREKRFTTSSDLPTT